jgi:hypothetical protein
VREDRLQKAKKYHKLSAEQLFASEVDFFAAGKLADLCVIATQDAQHLEHALGALELGYDLLLEKPIAANLEDCLTVYKKATELNRKVYVCHVLRYAPFFELIKRELESGAYGKPTVINHTENVAYWHQAHSYVRGNWRNSNDAAPMIIAKCCHDLDIISWLAKSKCKSVSSIGSLGYFKPENAPEGSNERCLNCAVKADCAFDAERFYITNGFDKGHKVWPVDVLCENATREKLYDALKTGPYGRCVWHCDNDVVDRQITNIDFESGLVAHLTMTGFCNDDFRRVHIHCEKGEIYGNMKENVLYCNIFGQPNGKAGFFKKLNCTKKINVGDYEKGAYGHGGGDLLLAKDIVKAFNGEKTRALTTLENSMQSHIIGFCAEKSRQQGGKAIDCEQV